MPYLFQLPIITQLTIQQQAVLNATGAVAVSGGPGTGKSVVSLWRHIRNHNMGTRNSLLLTYTKSLEYYLKYSASLEDESAGENVNRTYWWTTHLANNEYSEIIVDEAQDVEEEKYHQIKGLTPMVSYSADDNQILYPNKQTSQTRLAEIFPDNHCFTLEENYRNTYEITQFVRALFPRNLITVGQENGPKSRVVLSGSSIDKQVKIVTDIINIFSSDAHNIAILLPLIKCHAHEYQTVNYWHERLSNNGVTCSKFTNEEGDLGVIENVHITTFKSSKGLEFDTLIVPNINMFNRNTANLNVVKPNDYYVVFTRAKRNLYLIDDSEVNGNICTLPFMQVAIQRNIVEVDASYITV